MKEIIPSEWGLSSREFQEWVVAVGAEVIRKIYIDSKPAYRAEEFYFAKEVDLIAFKLTFAKEPPLRPVRYNYKGTAPGGISMYYCPYIPIGIGL